MKYRISKGTSIWAYKGRLGEPPDRPAASFDPNKRHDFISIRDWEGEDWPPHTPGRKWFLLSKQTSDGFVAFNAAIDDCIAI